MPGFQTKIARLNQTVLYSNFDYRVPTVGFLGQAGLLTYIVGGTTQVLDISVRSLFFNTQGLVRVYLARGNGWQEGAINQANCTDIHLIDEIAIASSVNQNSLSITGLVTKNYSNLFLNQGMALLLGANTLLVPYTVYSSVILDPTVYADRTGTVPTTRT